MLRYELADLALLCTACYLKLGTVASAEYSLLNGTVLLKLPLYYKLRDIQCGACGAEEGLLVANDKSGQRILCAGCLADVGSVGTGFVAEGSPSFLYALLRIKEFIPRASARSEGIRLRRKPGQKGGGVKKVKASDADAEKRRAHYESVKAASRALKTGKTVRAVGSFGTTPVISRASTPVAANGRISANRNKKALDKSEGGPKNAKKKSESKADSEKGVLKGAANKTAKKGRLNDVLSQSKTNGAKSGAKGGLEYGNFMEKVADHGEKPLKLSKSAGGKTNGSKVAFKSDKQSTAKKAAQTALKDAISDPTPSNAQNSVTVPQLPPGIFKYEPAPTPKLTYDSRTEYFNEMCYNLFREEKANLFTSSNAFLTAQDFVLEWYADQDKKHKMFKVQVAMTPEFLDRYVSKKMQALNKVPFSAGQSLMLVLGDDIVWYGSIALSESKSSSGKPRTTGKGHKSRAPARAAVSPKTLEIVVELYPWNTMPLPTGVNVAQLRLLPVSVPVSRVFTAMSRLRNPKFFELLQGKKPIRQLVFNNYLKLSRDNFNESQKVAIQSVMNNAITVLQGPPGTGKTSTIAEIIMQLLGNLNTYPILVVAASNIAIDNIAEKLISSHKQSILRIVSLEKEPEYGREHPLALVCLHHRVFDGLPLAAQETIREMRRPNAVVSQTQYKKLMTTQIDYSNKLIALARVIFTTTVVAGGNQLKLCAKIPVVIMDEATQSSEPTTLIPLTIPGVEKFVFVGDQNQLSSFSQVPNLALSLFERIILNGTYKTPHMLDTQYRMHPSISAFPRANFYQGKLKDGVEAADRVWPGIPLNPVRFWDTAGMCREHVVTSRFREDGGRTYANAGEVTRLEKVLELLIYDKGITRSRIGVITPYRGQRDLISATLVKSDAINPDRADVRIEVDRDDFFNESKPVTIHMVADIMIASVDAFQGREKDFLVMSCVRSNAEKKIGFLSDARRMNVALTRARCGLILVGDVACLRGDVLWLKYLDHLEERISVVADFSYD